MRLSLDALLVLDAIDRRGSFAAAGKVLHRVPSTISYSVAKLEQDLGVTLFERFGPRVVLTPAGIELLKEGRFLLKAAQDLEHRVRRVAQGWETEFAIGIDSMLDPLALADDLRAFGDIAQGTRVRVVQEVLSGSWEALLDGRADLLVGAPGEGPSGGGYHAEAIGSVRFVFAVAPTHPLASITQPLGRADLLAHRAIAAADSARRLLPRTVGLLSGQDILTVPDLRTKLAFQVAGLGVGYLPEPCARVAIAAGLLIEKNVDEPKPDETCYLAWRSGEHGAALAWWRERMRQANAFSNLLACGAQGVRG